MSEVFRISTNLELGGNLAPETVKLLRRLEQIETKAKAIPRELDGWKRPLAAAGREVERLATAMAKVRTAAKGQMAPANEVVRWAAASARELGDMRKAARGVGSSTRGIGKTLDGWEGKINRSVRALERMERIASRMRFPDMPSAPRGGYGSGGGHSPRSGGNSSHGGSGRSGGRRGHGGYGHAGSHEGSALASMVGIGGGVHTAEATIEPGMEMKQIALGMRQAGASEAQIAHAKEAAEAASKAFPNLSTLEVFEHINDLRGIVGDMDKAVHEMPDILPIFAALKAKMGSKGGATALREVYAAVKSAETANEVTAEGIREHTTDLARLSFWYGDKLNPSKYFSAQKAAGQMLTLTSDRFRHGVFPALTQELDQRAGTQFSVAAAKVVAGLKMTGRGLTKADDYGLLDKKTVEYSNAGLVKPGAQFTDVGLDGKHYDRMKDPDLWLYNVVIPRLAAGNKKTQSGAEAPGLNVADKGILLQVLGQIYTDKSAYAFFSELAAQRTKIEKDYQGYLGTSGDFTKYLRDSPNAATQGAQAQSNSLAAALSGPAVPGLVENLNKFNAGLATATGYLEKHPLLAEGLTAGGLGVVGGLATAGAVGLTIMAVSTLSLPALAIGSVTALTIAALTIPWDKIYETMGWKPGIGMGGKDDGGVKSNAEDGLPGVGPSITQAQAERDRKRAAGIQGLGNSYQNVIDAQKRLADATGRTGTMADSARPLVDRLSNALLEFAKKLIITEGVLSNISFNGGGGGGGEGGGLIHKASLGGGGRDVPDFGGGAGGSGSSAFDAIMRAEGTAGKDPYNVVLGNGKYGLPSKPLTEMTLREAYAFGRTVRARHGASSALGAFQIVGRTMKQHMGAVGLGWDDKFSPENQRKLARDIARTEGLGAWEGFKSHPHERAKARSGTWNTRPDVPPPPKQRELVATHNLNVDGRKMASIVTRHQFDAANGPATGANFADASELYPQLG